MHIYKTCCSIYIWRDKEFSLSITSRGFSLILGPHDWDYLFLGLRKLYYTRNYLINHECTDQEICPGACVNLLTRGRGRPIFSNFYTFSFSKKVGGGGGPDPLKLPFDPCMYNRRVCTVLGYFLYRAITRELAKHSLFHIYSTS